ncbi:MAG: HEXXH motif-containing putative peptide modification protein [Spirochaetota bacterium]
MLLSLKNIQKWKKELAASLAKEFSNKIEFPQVSYRKKIYECFQVYQNNQSLAGMEMWLIHYHEWFYFHELQEDLQQTPTQHLSSYQAEVSQDLQNDFGREDYRFLAWEQAETDKRSLRTVILACKKKILAVLQTSNDRFLQNKGKAEKRIAWAEQELQLYWPEGFSIYKELTSRVIAIAQKDVVSYSRFSEFGISYINLSNRSPRESIDDLIHESGHHHLNLILKKYKLIRKDFSEAIFYSPWRKELRPPYAIFHAVFTFAYAARLFYAILQQKKILPTSKLQANDLDFFRHRFLEEVLQIKFSLYDLEIAKQNQFFSKKGEQLLQLLQTENTLHLKKITTVQKRLENNSRIALAHLREELKQQRKKYRLFKDRF